MPENQRVRANCGLEGYESFWIEFDVSSWGFNVYRELYGDMFVHEIILTFIPRYSTAWHVENSDGTAIVHPGPRATQSHWDAIWDQFDVKTSRVLHPWFMAVAYSALTEAMGLPPKSSGDGKSDSGGADGDGDGGEG